MITYPHDLAKSQKILLQRGERIRPSEKDVEKVKNFELPYYHFGERAKGRVHLPVKHLDLVTRDPAASQWGALITVSPRLGALGFLFGEPPPLPCGLLEFSTRLWAGLLFFTIFVLAGERLIFKRSFALGARSSLLAWFFGLAMIPLALSLVSGVRNLSDLRESLQEELQQQLDRAIQSVEAGSSQVGPRLVTECCRFLQDNPTWNPEQEILTASGSGDPIRSFLNKSIFNSVAEVDAIFVNSVHGFEYSHVHSSISPASKRLFATGLKNLIKTKIHLEKKLGRPPNSTEILSNDPWLSSISGKTETHVFRPGALSYVGLGEKQIFTFYMETLSSGLDRFGILLLFRQETLLENHLSSFMEQWEARSPFDLGVFKESGASSKIVAEGGNIQGLEKISALSGLTSTIVTPDHILLRKASRFLDKYIYVGRASTEKIQRQLWLEVKSMGLTWALLLILVGAGGVALSQWLAAPVVKMSDTLEQVSKGMFSHRMSFKRGDELGRTADTLDAMIQKLDERRRMSHFVNQTVLETISLNSGKAPGTAKRDSFVALVSDIRGFTTLSEKYPPQSIFNLLNRHLELAARIIQRNHGIVERFIGDAVQAVFPVSGTSPQEGAKRALTAAIETMEAHQDLQRERAAAGDFGYGIGIGLEIGPMVHGVVGDPETRLDLSFLGEPLSRAAVLESASRNGQFSRIVCSTGFRDLFSENERFAPLRDFEDAWELIDSNAGKPDPLTTSAAPSSVYPSPEPSQAPPPSFTPASPPAHNSLSAGVSHFRLAILILLTLLVTFLPAFLMYQKEVELNQEIEAAQQSEARRLLQLDHRLLSRKNLDSQPFADMIKLELDQAAISAPTGDARATALTQEVQKRMNAVKKQFPSFHWIWVTRSSNTLDLKHYGAATFHVAGHSDPLQLSGEDTSLFIAAAAGQFFFPQLIWGHNHPWGELFENLLPNASIFNTHCCWQPGRVSKNERISWFSVFAPEWWESSDRFLPRPTTGFLDKDGALPLNQAFLGALVCFWDQPKIPPEACRHGLFKLLENNGGKVVAWDPRHPGSFLGNLDPASETWILNAIEKAGQGEIFENHLVQSTRISGFPDLRAIICRSIADNQNKPGTRLFFLALCFSLLFTILILHTILSSGGRILRISLQMILAFLFVLLPSLAVGIVSAEKAFIARSARLIPRLAKEGQGKISLFNRGFPAWTAYGAAVMDQLLRSTRVQRILSRLAEDKTQRQNQSINFIREASWEVLHRGWFMRSPAFYIFDKDEIYYPKGMASRASLGLEDQFSRQLIRRTLSSMNPTLANRISDSDSRLEMLEGAKMEEITAISRAVTPPEVAPEVSHHPFSSVLGTSKNDNYWIRHILVNGSPLFLVRTDWCIPVLFFQHLSTWFSDSSARDFIVSLPEALNQHFEAPYVLFDLSTIYPEIGFSQLFSPNDPRFAHPQMLAYSSDEPFLTTSGSGTSEILQLAEPKKDQNGTLISCLMPLGMEREALLWAHRIDQTLFMGALLFAVFLAYQAARRYTYPLLELSAKAQGIQDGDYSVRMAPGHDDEFGQLAKNFNVMAQGVHEGRLLSRFVSESVREAAQSRDLEQEAERGTAEELVVVFSGLKGFSELLGELPPELLIGHLNRYLGVMARIIRDQGGRIDKFIGDKILAVFRPCDFSGSPEAMVNALSAVRKMQKQMSDFSNSLPCVFGGGLVFGPVLSGIMGTSEVRREYTVIGDTVNLASRLCDLALKQPGGGIVIEAAGQKQLSFSTDRSWGYLKRKDANTVKGKTRQVDVFILSDPDKP